MLLRIQKPVGAEKTYVTKPAGTYLMIIHIGVDVRLRAILERHIQRDVEPIGDTIVHADFPRVDVELHGFSVRCSAYHSLGSNKPRATRKVAVREVNLPLMPLELRNAALPQTGGVKTNRHSTLRERWRGNFDE